MPRLPMKSIWALLLLTCLNLLACDGSIVQRFSQELEADQGPSSMDASLDRGGDQGSDGGVVSLDRALLDFTLPLDGYTPGSGPSDRGTAERGIDDLALPDQAAPFDSGLPPLPEPGPAPRLECPIDPVEGLILSQALEDQRVSATIGVGQAQEADSLFLANLSPAPGLEWLSMSGGRAEVGSFNGERLWRSESQELREVITYRDFDGDGLFELLFTSGNGVAMIDALSGRELWRSPSAPVEGAPPFFAIGKAIVADLNGDTLPDLYITDIGCSANGTGYGRAYAFSRGFSQPEVLGAFTGPRAGGRCTRWHSVQVGQAGEALIAIPDRSGLQLFSAETGERHLCSDLSGMEIIGRLSHLAVDGGWFVVNQQLIGFAEEIEGESPNCLGEASHVGYRWRLNGEGFRAEGGGVLDLGGGAYGVVVSRQAERGWETLLLSTEDGRTLQRFPASAALGITKLPSPVNPNEQVDALLLAEGPDANLLPPFHVQLYQRESGSMTLRPRWASPLEDLQPVYRDHDARGRSSDWRALQRIDHPDGLKLLFQRVPSLGERWLILADEGGVVTEYRLMQQNLGGIQVACADTDCVEGDRLLLSVTGGELILLNASLEERSGAALGEAPVQIATGRSVTRFVPTPDAALAGSGEPLAILSRTLEGRLTLSQGLKDASIDRPLQRRWSQLLGQPPRGPDPEAPLFFPTPTLGERAGVIVASDYTDPSRLTVLGLDLSQGNERWRHVLPQAIARTMHSPVSALIDGEPWLWRHEIITDPTRLEESLDPSCPLRFANSVDFASLLAPQEDCRYAPRPRQITALDPRDGRCRWALLLRPSDECNRRSNQRLSLADGDGDRRPELYLTESNALHRLDPSEGTIEASHTLEDLPGAGRGGGTVIATGQDDIPLIRVAGNAQPDAFSMEMDLLWRVPVHPWVSRGGWLNRPHQWFGGSLWSSPEARLPLHRHDLTGALTGRFLLSEGDLVETEDDEAQGTPIQQISLDSAQESLMVSDSAGWLYSLDSEGRLRWSRAFDREVRVPVSGDWDADGETEWLISRDDGRILLLNQPVLSGPPEVWDEACDETALSCVSSGDLDERPFSRRLCAAWVPLDGVDRYEVRVETVSGLPVTPWVEVNGNTVVIEVQELSPGISYRVAVRSLVIEEDRISRSAPVRSDGLRLIDEIAPAVALGIDRDLFEIGESIEARLEATDDAGLVSLRLSLLSASAESATLLDQTVTGRRFARLWTWDGRLSDGSLPAPGAYLLVLRVTDLARNQTVRAVGIELR
ncbi:MAG: hypothetical protein VYD19_10130 [Myxococcota bacterium]|nr:hypothetical protein [Myxococcota bacterium]